MGFPLDSNPLTDRGAWQHGARVGSERGLAYLP